MHQWDLAVDRFVARRSHNHPKINHEFLVAQLKSLLSWSWWKNSYFEMQRKHGSVK